MALHSLQAASNISESPPCFIFHQHHGVPVGAVSTFSSSEPIQPAQQLFRISSLQDIATPDQLWFYPVDHQAAGPFFCLLQTNDPSASAPQKRRVRDHHTISAGAIELRAALIRPTGRSGSTIPILTIASTPYHRNRALSVSQDQIFR
jgi:hypothetical protein